MNTSYFERKNIWKYILIYWIPSDDSSKIRASGRRGSKAEMSVVEIKLFEKMHWHLYSSQACMGLTVAGLWRWEIIKIYVHAITQKNPLFWTILPS